VAESVVGALLAVVIALIGRRIGGDQVGALAGILWSIYPLGVFIAGLVYPTSVLTMLLAGGVLCFLPNSDQELSAKRVFLAGIVWGLAALTTPAVLATIGAISLWAMYWVRVNRFRVVFLLVLGSALTIVPWTIRDFYVYDRLVVVEPRIVEHLPPIGNTENKMQESKIEMILNHPADFAARFGREFLHFWQVYPDRLAMDWFREKAHETDRRIVKDTMFARNNLVTLINVLSTGPLFLFAIIGTVTMWFEQKRRGNLALLWTIILSFAVVYSIFYTKTRYRIPIEPYIIILSAYGIKKIWDLVAARFACGKVKAKVKVEAAEQVRGSTFDVRG
jgi:4-amino-4-deoxy-L-arabinose transferase-like glycosyltransferase